MELPGFTDLLVHQLEDPHDPRLASWLELYREAFPPEERVPEQSHVRLLQERAEGEDATTHLLALCRAREPRSLAMARYSYHAEASFGYLMYFAVIEELRSKGIGSALYREILRRLRQDAEPRRQRLRGVLMEVEDPEQAESPGAREMAARRVGFYRRLGVRQLTGIRYTQQVTGQPPIEMLVFVHPLDETLSAGEVLLVAQRLLGGIEVVASLPLQIV